jgi:hypothetical protein
LASVWWIERAEATTWLTPNATTVRADSNVSKSTAGAIILTLLMIFQSYILLNLGRGNESLLTGNLLILICAFLFFRPSVLAATCMGICLGLAIFIRPNAGSLFLLAAIWTMRGAADGLRAQPIARSALLMTVISLAAAGTYMAGSLAATGCLLYLPTNGAYNFYAGTNAFASQAFSTYCNGETSLIPALQSNGVNIEPRDVQPSTYFRLGEQFVTGDPLGEVRLLLTKLIVFFSPRLAQADTLFKVAGQIAQLSPHFWRAKMQPEIGASLR